MNRVVTLPITPVLGRSFLSLLTPFVGDLISRALDAPFHLMLNTVGMKSAESGSQWQFETYLQKMHRIGLTVHRDFTHDGTVDFEEHFNKWFGVLLNKGQICTNIRQMAWCDCGRVEIPVAVLDVLIKEQRKKSLVQGVTRADATCRKCGGHLSIAEESVLELNVPPVMPDAIIPSLYERELEEISERISQRPLVISRRHRAGAGLCPSGDMVVDTDFRWMGYLGYIAHPEDSVLIVSSPTTLNQAIKVVALSSLLYPRMRISLLVHPLVRIVDGRTSISRLDIDEFLEICGSALLSRMFLSMGLQWNDYETIIKSEELYFLRRTIESRILWPEVSGQRTRLSSVEEVLRIINRNVLVGLYKSLRSGQPLSAEQSTALLILSPPASS